MSHGITRPSSHFDTPDIHRAGLARRPCGAVQAR